MKKRIQKSYEVSLGWNAQVMYLSQLQPMRVMMIVMMLLLYATKKTMTGIAGEEFWGDDSILLGKILHWMTTLLVEATAMISARRTRSWILFPAEAVAEGASAVATARGSPAESYYFGRALQRSRSRDQRRSRARQQCICAGTSQIAYGHCTTTHQCATLGYTRSPLVQANDCLQMAPKLKTSRSFSRRFPKLASSSRRMNRQEFLRRAQLVRKSFSLSVDKR